MVTGGSVRRGDAGGAGEFGEHRVIDAPLAESGIVGAAVGMAMRGYRPVVEIQFDGFVYPAFDQIVSRMEGTRVNQRAQRYLRDLRRDAVVDYR